MKRVVLFISFISLFMAGYANNRALIDSAEVYYLKGEYGNAINAYQRVLNDGVQSPELYYNLANSFYKSGKVTDAILNYERAKLLSPDDEDIYYNLELANKHVVDKIEVLPEFFVSSWIDNFRGSFTSDNWAILSMAAFVVFLALFLVYFFSGNIIVKKAGFWMGLLVLLISATSFVFSYHQKQEVLNHNTAIIYTPSITIKSSPDESGTDIFLLHEGTKVKVVDSVGEWREIKLSDGNEGWLKASDIIMI